MLSSIYELILTVVFWRLSWPFIYDDFKIFSDISKLCGLVMSRKSVLENMGTGFSSLEPPLEQEYCEDQLI